MSNITKGIIVLILITVIGSVAIVSVNDLSEKTAKETIDSAQSNGYIYYYEGEEVDPTKFVPSYYDYYYNHENKTVIMEKKKPRYYGYGIWR